MAASVTAAVRFIPTCVGNSHTVRSAPRVSPVHPHVCGELMDSEGTELWCCGSSPRVWGTRIFPSSRLRSRRFIPTCVGNSHKMPSLRYATTVHPHVCGELFVRFSASTTPIGSSPRVWGTQLHETTAFPAMRFIPTCVGNSPPFHLPHSRLSVHPHVCGELSLPALSSRTWSGSSPRVWGTLTDPCLPTCLSRFIPTCVGNSRFKRPTATTTPVHPHVCGELRIIERIIGVAPGSSPRVWGTHDLTDGL